MLVRTCIHRTAPSTSSQPPCRRTFVRCLEMHTNSHSLLGCTVAAIIFQARWMNPIDISYGFGAALYLTGHSTPVVGARGRPATHCLLWWRGPRILVVRLNHEFWEFLGPECSLQRRGELCPSMTDSLVTELSNFDSSGKLCLFGRKLWISVARFAMSCSNESPRACDMLRSLCIIKVNCSGSRSICFVFRSFRCKHQFFGIISLANSIVETL